MSHSMSHFFLGCRTKILACRSDTLKPLVDQPEGTIKLKVNYSVNREVQFLYMLYMLSPTSTAGEDDMKLANLALSSHTPFILA